MTRGSLAHFIDVAQLLRRGRPFTSVSAAAEIRVDPRTIKRDIWFLRRHLGWEIRWDSNEGTYRLVSAPPPTLI